MALHLTILKYRFGDLRGLQLAEHGLFVTDCLLQTVALRAGRRSRDESAIWSTALAAADGAAESAAPAESGGDLAESRARPLRSVTLTGRGPAGRVARLVARRTGSSQHGQCCQCDYPCHRCSQCVRWTGPCLW